MDLSLHEVIRAQADGTPEAIAVMAPQRAPLTYRRLHSFIDEMVETLAAMGVGRGDRVVVVLPDGPQLALAFLAISSVATVAPLSPAYSGSELDFYISNLSAKALIIQEGLLSPARDLARSQGLCIIELSPLPETAGLFRLAGERAHGRVQSHFAGPHDVALVLYTSGSESRPKRVPLTHENIYFFARNNGRALGLVESDRCLNVMPLFHVHGILMVSLSSILAGSSVVYPPGFDAATFFQWMDEFRPTWFSAVPPIHQAILAYAEANREIIERTPLRFIRSGSAELPPRVMEELERVFNRPVINTYGLTEAAPIAIVPSEPSRRKPGSVGVAVGMEIAIMDDEGLFLKAGETGEIVVRGEGVMKGYEDDPVSNSNAFVDGWFRTGDQGHLDDGGYLFLTGRLKEIINRGGERLSPKEVDDALMGHPDVAQAVTFGVPHPTLGEEIATAVVLRDGAGVREQDLRTFVSRRLADFKVPCCVVIVPEIPKSATGKLKRLGLADKLGLTLSDLASRARTDFIAPRTQVEASLAQCWAQVLGLNQVSIHDNFFIHLGGDSISATRVISRVHEEFHVELTVRDLFAAPTVADFGLAIVQRTADLADHQTLTEVLAEVELLSEDDVKAVIDAEE
jgi:acyl-CoA synthetase (AMP-forming)/AMP-acid ligase II/acyl carrier protein